MIGNPYKGRGFKGLIRYLHFGRQGEENPHRVEWHVARNMPTSDPDVVPSIMRATADLSPGVQKPVYHLPVSWPRGEEPDRDTQLAVADQLVKALKENGYDKPRIEGLPSADWVLVDASDVIVHIFRPEVREFYNIEKMWAADFGTDAH